MLDQVYLSCLTMLSKVNLSNYIILKLIENQCQVALVQGVSFRDAADVLTLRRSLVINSSNYGFITGKIKVRNQLVTAESRFTLLYVITY